MPRIIEVKPLELKQWIDNGIAVIIDVREENEFKQQHIQQSTLHPLSTFDPSAVASIPNKKIVFMCRSGKRSAVAAAQWAEFHDVSEAYSMQGGLEAWKSLGLSVSS